MKTLEEVIKYKLNFLPERIDPFYDIQTYERQWGQISRDSIIYKTKKYHFFNATSNLLEGVIPLFVYISSCDMYYRENGFGEFSDIYIHTINELSYVNNFGYLRLYDFGDHRISLFKSYVHDYILRLGFHHQFTKPLILEFKGYFWYNLTIQEQLERFHLEADTRETEEELSINDSRTFKSDQCVICLKKEPKVLFCNCGHICICEKCVPRRYDNCRVCKKENTILRIIE